MAFPLCRSRRSRLLRLRRTADGRGGDHPVAWQLAVIRAIVHTASREIQGGRIPESKAETAMISTALAAIAETK